jgi:Na+/melibiose symporter-like transporter
VLGGQLIARVGKYKWQTVFGAGLIVVAMAMLRTVDVGMPLWHISVVMFVLGLGFGLVLPTMSLVIQNAVAYQYLGVASSSSQFFRQIGSVLGIAVFGAILANTYHSEFESRLLPDDRAAVGPEIAEQFDDPTAKLNQRQFAITQAQVTALPGGADILKRATGAQAASVSVAVRRIFTAALGAAILSMIFAIAIQELPLRRSVGGPAQAAGPPAGGRRAPEPSPLPDRPASGQVEPTEP